MELDRAPSTKYYKVQVVIHTDTTYSEHGFLKYLDPLTVDELAVQHRELDFMLCHLGAPVRKWLMRI